MGFKQQKINRIIDAVQHFYYRLKSNLTLLNEFFSKSTDSECILTFFCSNNEKAASFSYAYRLRFDELRSQILKLLLNNDYTVFQRNLKKCKIDYDISNLNKNIQTLMHSLFKLNGSVSNQRLDKEYFNNRPIYFCGNENKTSEEMAFDKAKELKNLIDTINEEIDAFTTKVD